MINVVAIYRANQAALIPLVKQFQVLFVLMARTLIVTAEGAIRGVFPVICPRQHRVHVVLVIHVCYNPSWRHLTPYFQGASATVQSSLPSGDFLCPKRATEHFTNAYLRVQFSFEKIIFSKENDTERKSFCQGRKSMVHWS
jgi:hypothetical protein